MSDLQNNASLNSAYFVQGFMPSNITANTIDFSEGSARASQNPAVIEVNETKTVDISTLGAGGVWPVPVSEVVPGAGDIKFLWLYAIQDNAGVSGLEDALLVSTSDEPLEDLPETYNLASVVGLVIIDENGELVNHSVRGRYGHRDYTLQDAVEVFSSASPTSPTAVNLTTESGVVPGSDVVTDALIRFDLTTVGVTQTAALAPTGLTPASEAPFVIQYGTIGQAQDVLKVAVGDDGGDSSIDVSVSEGTATIALKLAGFSLDLPIALK